MRNSEEDILDTPDTIEAGESCPRDRHFLFPAAAQTNDHCHRISNPRVFLSNMDTRNGSG